MTALPRDTRDTLYNGEVEHAVIGAPLIEPAVIAAIAKVVRPEDFYLESCGWAFEAELQLYRDGKAIDTLTLEAELAQRDHWAGTGSVFLSDCISATPTALHAVSHGEVVADFSKRRRALDLSGALAKAALSSNGTFPAELALTAATLTKMSEGLKPSDKSRRVVHCDIEMLEPLKPLDEIVRGVLAAEQVNVWSGDGGIGKTYCAIDLCAAVAYGKTRWVDFDIVNGGPALIVDEQSGHRRLVRRVKNVLVGHGIEPQGRIAWLTFPHYKLVSQPKDADALRETIRAANARVVIFDSLLNVVESTGTGNPENDSVSMGDLFSVLRQVACECECTIILLHHVNRGGGYRGSTAIKDESDGLVILSRAGDSDVVRFKSEKLRDFEPFGFSAKLNFGSGTFNLSPMSVDDDKGERLSKTMIYCLDFWAGHGDSKIKDMAGPDSPFKEATIRSAVNDLVNMGRAVRRDSGGTGVIGTYGLPTQMTVTL